MRNKTNAEAAEQRNARLANCTRAMTIGATILATVPTAAFAVDGAGLFNQVRNLLKNAVVAFGGILVVWGAVGIGMALKDGQGMQMDTNVGKGAGGIMMIVAAQTILDQITFSS